ncbi:hypothetical protein AAFF_G00302400 [Aldrovandia affinis]|uniref:Uncharacterized protein n=1 Tax=Aldrovandia affinis TaxID=143900 RepID=A0AAD7R8N1_9TELE|nr:hypothetical protein AAFF_G00302400 [Aldrovandia affinis]
MQVVGKKAPWDWRGQPPAAVALWEAGRQVSLATGRRRHGSGAESRRRWGNVRPPWNEKSGSHSEESAQIDFTAAVLGGAQRQEEDEEEDEEEEQEEQEQQEEEEEQEQEEEEEQEQEEQGQEQEEQEQQEEEEEEGQEQRRSRRRRRSRRKGIAASGSVQSTVSCPQLVLPGWETDGSFPVQDGRTGRSQFS